MPLSPDQHDWLGGVIDGLTALSDNRWMMPSDHLATVLHELASVVQRCVPGAVVEMGCAGGRTNLRLAAFLRLLGEGPGRQLHAYDSFKGFPPLTPEDHPGDTSRENLRYVDGGLPVLFSDWGDCLPLPVVHAGFFDERESDPGHPDQVAFALVDCDAHDSVLMALRIVWPRMSPGGTVVIHDHGNPVWPGVEKACGTHFASGTMRDVGRWDVRHGTVLVVTKGE